MGKNNKEMAENFEEMSTEFGEMLRNFEGIRMSDRFWQRKNFRRSFNKVWKIFRIIRRC